MVGINVISDRFGTPTMKHSWRGEHKPEWRGYNKVQTSTHWVAKVLRSLPSW